MKYVIIFLVTTAILSCMEIFRPIRKQYLKLYPHRNHLIGATFYYATTLGLGIVFSPVFFYICLFSKSRCDKMRRAVIEDLIKFEERYK